MLKRWRKHLDIQPVTTFAAQLVLNRRRVRIPASPDHSGLELSDGVRSRVLQRNLRCHGEFPPSKSDRKWHGFVVAHHQRGQLMRTHRPVSDGFGHEVVLSNVLSEGNQSARLVQHVLPHQTWHPRHALDPRNICRDVGPRVGRAKIHLRAGKGLSPAALRRCHIGKNVHPCTCPGCNVRATGTLALPAPAWRQILVGQQRRATRAPTPPCPSSDWSCPSGCQV